MKKIISLILCFVFLLSFTACGEENDNKTNHSVDIEYYVALGQINDLNYKLGDSVNSTKESLQETLDDHGESNYFDYESGDYTVMTDGAVYCCYKTADKKAGLTHVVKAGDAFGFTAGAVSTEIRDVMSGFGFDAKEREAKRDEIFFLPTGTSTTVLKYEIEENTLLFVFQDHYLAATVIFK